MERHTDQAMDHLHSLYCEGEYSFSGTTRREFDAWQEPARGRLCRLIGLEEIARSARGFEPSVTLGDPEDIGYATRAAGIIRTEPFFDIPFWILRPKSPGPHPLAIFPHGHYPQRGLDKAVGIADSHAEAERIFSQNRDVAVQAVKNGFVAIAQATRGFSPACLPDLNKRFGGRDCRSHLLYALLAGRTLIGERVWDIQRLIDWAQTRPDINTRNLLVMGNSGGGVATLFAAACEPRITIAVSSCAFCAFVGQSGRLTHCDCNTVPGLLRFGKIEDIAGLIAPRHLLAVNGRLDTILPVQDVDPAVSETRRIFNVAGAGKQFAHYYGEGGHRFYADLMWPFVMQASGRISASAINCL